MSNETINIIVYEETDEETPDNNDGSRAKSADGFGLGLFGDDDNWAKGEQAKSEQDGSKDATMKKIMGSLQLRGIDVSRLEHELKEFMQTADKMFNKAYLEAQMESMELSEIELALAITAEGSLGLPTIGAKLASTRVIVLKFKPKNS